MSALKASELLRASYIGSPLLLIAVVVLWLLYRIIIWFASPLFSPLRHINGPPGTSLLLGSLKEIMEGGAYKTLCQFKEQYGHVFVIKAVLGSWRLITTDKKAIAHMLANNMIYYKPEPTRFHLSYLIGHGLISAEGLEHRHQRRIMNPAFSPGHLRDILPVFLAKSSELCDILLQQFSATPAQRSSSSIRIDILHYLHLTTLDIIGLAGFNYDFNALRHGEDGNEFAATLHRVSSPESFPFILFLKGFIPALRVIEFDKHARMAAKLRRIAGKVGMELIEQGRQQALQERASACETVLEKGHDKDLLSLMVKANMSTDTPPEQRLSIEQILNQILTFLIAGHETTASSTAWGIFAISQRPSIQSRLRTELLEAFSDDSTPITLEALNGLTYLDAVVREIFRYHPPVEFSARQPQVDDTIPLDNGFVGRDGKYRDHIDVKKGDFILLPIALVNRMKEFWGEDADEFNPDRWLQGPPSSASTIPGVWANLLTFLGGPRSCIGFKFAILEMKALLFHLIRTFEFELAVSPEDIIRKERIVTRPLVRNETDKGAQMPVFVRPVKLVEEFRSPTKRGIDVPEVVKL